MGALIRRLVALFRRSRLERDLQDELSFHLAMRESEHLQRGLPAKEARAAARRSFGGVAFTREQIRDVWRFRWLEQSLQDGQYALRALRKSPGFSCAAVLILALGIGGTTAMFSVVRGVLLKPLPYPDADRLIAVWETAPGLQLAEVPVSASLYFSLRDDSQVFDDVGVWNAAAVSVTGIGEPEEVQSLSVTDGILPLLGIEPVLGRRFLQQDDSPDSTETAMITYGYWQRKFGADAAVVGRSIVVNGRPRAVIGVLPQTFWLFDKNPAVVLPFRFDRSRAFLGQFNYQGIARLKRGITLTEANIDVARILATYPQRWPAPAGFNPKVFEEARFAPNLRPLKQDAIGDTAKILWILMASVAIVLVIACANVANLLLARVEARQHEFAIRAALGASRIRIAGGLLAESLALAATGGLVGAGAAYGALRALSTVAPVELPRRAEIVIDPQIALFTVAIIFWTASLLSLAPVLKSIGRRLGHVLESSTRSATPSRDRHHVRNTLIIVQVALALVLLISSGLMLRTFQALKRVQPGFMRADEIQTMRVSLPQGEPERMVRMQQDMLQHIREIQSVRFAAFGNALPMDRNFLGGGPIFVEDRPFQPGQIAPVRRFKSASPGFFQAIGTPLLVGRDFTWDDVYGKRSVALISENLARELWHEPAVAIGKRIRETPNGHWREIIGVVGDVREEGLRQQPPAVIYWPLLVDMFGQETWASRSVAFVIRSDRTGTEWLVGELQQAVWAVNPNVPLASVRPLSELYRQSIAQTSLTLVLLAIAGGVALLLGLVGIYGVISYAVSQRTREIGIRVALGARPAAVRAMFVKRSVVLAAIGVTAGLLIAFATLKVTSSVLYEVKPVDPATYTVASIAVVAAVICCSYLPARRATKVDPVVALRCE